MAQLGVFLVPPAEHPFYQVASGILGYDIWSGARAESTLAGLLDDTLLGWIGEATAYGLHCTITGGAIIYDDADIDEVKTRVAWIASRTAPFTLVNGRFYDDFHANPKALVCDFASPDGALQRLHQLAATTISPLHRATFSRPSRDPNDERAAELYARFGEAWVLERFRPHWTLMSGLPDAESWATARQVIAAQTGLFTDDRTRTLPINTVELVQRGDDGYCFVAASYPLTGNG